MNLCTPGAKAADAFSGKAGARKAAADAEPVHRSAVATTRAVQRDMALARALR
eukprot:CAMPEP_0197909416 /NCGR_PEP_ID=MMETSP1439-20131203/68849_1 /TAXON_ID=66791 /ORGANISM="Gonyaulax spinifera, Strain CCMP409" /LENGTH=52 /DNA_ID=CAMNT_0043530993 /DNA_START=317 /DNA_END=475 /DNA_ORIENTATION=-